VSITRELREAIERDGRSINALARTTGLSPIQVSRFIRGERGLNTPAVDALCEALGLELRPRRNRRQKGGK